MNIGYVLKLALFFIISAAIVASLCCFFGVFDAFNPLSSMSYAENVNIYKTVIIDAGHGGEDGGASSASGLVEKNVNLEISQMLCDMLKASGINTVMTRTDDRLLYDRNVDFHGRKKKLDLAARLQVANTYEESIFISIHMNSFSDPKYSGLQVWYSKNDPASTVLAQMIQSEVKGALQPQNNRKIKAADSKIFLLDNATSPSVLIECGFLSNPEEARKFEDLDYKRQLAFVIFESIMEFLDKEASAT